LIGLLSVDVHKAEYWDGESSTMIQLFEIAKANLTDTLPDMGEHEKLG
jgi:Pyridoxamine 5'-phosphate oxidase like